jgi:hypothetical protein
MLGRLNAAAFNQAGNLDRGIDDASEHFAYVPRRCLANAQDVAFFLSTRLVVAAPSSSSSSSSGERDDGEGNDGKRNDDDGGDCDGGGGRAGGEAEAVRAPSGGTGSEFGGRDDPVLIRSSRVRPVRPVRPVRSSSR